MAAATTETKSEPVEGAATGDAKERFQESAAKRARTTATEEASTASGLDSGLGKVAGRSSFPPPLPPLALIPEQACPRDALPLRLDPLTGWLSTVVKGRWRDGAPPDAFPDPLLQDLASLMPWILHAQREDQRNATWDWHDEVSELFGESRLHGNAAQQFLCLSLRYLAEAAEDTTWDALLRDPDWCALHAVEFMLSFLEPSGSYDPNLWRELGAMAAWGSDKTFAEFLNEAACSPKNNPRCKTEFLRSSIAFLARRPRRPDSPEACAKLQSLLGKCKDCPEDAAVLWAAAKPYEAFRRTLAAAAVGRGFWAMAQSWLAVPPPEAHPGALCPVCFQAVGSRGGPPSKQCIRGHVTCGSCFERLWRVLAEEDDEENIAPEQRRVRCPECRWEAPRACFSRNQLADRLGREGPRPCFLGCGAMLCADAVPAHEARACPCRREACPFSYCDAVTRADELTDHVLREHDWARTLKLPSDGCDTQSHFLTSPPGPRVLLRLAELLVSDKTVELRVETVPGTVYTNVRGGASRQPILAGRLLLTELNLRPAAASYCRLILDNGKATSASFRFQVEGLAAEFKYSFSFEFQAELCDVNFFLPLLQS